MGVHVLLHVLLQGAVTRALRRPHQYRQDENEPAAALFFLGRLHADAGIAAPGTSGYADGHSAMQYDPVGVAQGWSAGKGHGAQGVGLTGRRISLHRVVSSGLQEFENGGSPLLDREKKFDFSGR